MARPVIIDCDPGVDDCIALMAALGAPEQIDVKAICTVAGNVSIETCSRNAGGLLNLAGRPDIPVFAGCARPMRVAPQFAEHIHGATGLGDAELPAPERPLADRHAVDFLVETLGDAPAKSITLVITGPMTNFAEALKRAPGIIRGVSELIIMGGAHEAGGNITPHAEFNIYADPHAADIVLSCGAPITLIGLDATLQLRCTPTRMETMRASRHPALKAATAMIEHVNRVYGEVYGADGAALHDPCTIGYILAPELFSAAPAHVSVITEEGAYRGHTAVDASHTGERPGRVNWVTGLDSDALFGLLMEKMEAL